MQKLHVLIIEDSEDDALLLVRALCKGGYEPIYRLMQTEKAVRAALKAEKWDLIISDHEMPSFSAPAALAVLQESGQDLPFIIVSGAIGEEMAVEAMKAGAHDFIKKGKLGRLIPVIERELKNAESRREQRNAEAALRQREQDFRALAENAPDIVARYDRRRRYLYVNPAIEKDTGMPRDSFIGYTHEELRLHEKGINLWNEAFTEAFTTGRETTLYFDYPSPAGIKYYHTRVVPECGPAGAVETVLTITRDVTELKKMEAELQEDLAKTRRLHLKSLPDLPPALPGVTLFSHYQPAKQLNGDFYNLIQKDHKLIFYLADSPGNGLDGIMLSIFVQKTLKKFLEVSGVRGRFPSPQNILQHLLEDYERENPGEACPLSILLAVLDTETGELRHAAYQFHCTPLLVKGDGDILELETEARLPLQEYSNPFINGSTLLVYTDGFIKQGCDATPCSQLKSLLQAHRHDPPELFFRAIKETMQLHGNPYESDDDITMLVLQSIDEKQRLALKVESEFSNIEEIKKSVYAFITSQTAAKIDMDMLGFHELLVNAIEHGNKWDWGKRVFVDVTVGKNYYRIVIEDEGDGFNWQDRISRKLDFNDYYERGRGIIMTDMLSDYLGYNKRGNRVTMINLIN